MSDDTKNKEFQHALIETMVSHGIDEKQASGMAKGVIRKITPKKVDDYLKEAIAARYNTLEQTGALDALVRKHIADKLEAAMKGSSMRTLVAEEAKNVAKKLFDFLFQHKQGGE